MDLLTDILREAGLRRRLLNLRDLGEGAALHFPCDRSMGLHVLTHGRLFIHHRASEHRSRSIPATLR